MRWVTHRDVRVAGTACPWLIARYIDDDPEFGFFPAGEAAAIAAREGGQAFAVPGARFGPEGGAFDALIAAYNLAVPGLDRLARIVAAAERGGNLAAPESIGLAAVVEGVALAEPGDIERQRALWPVYDALLAYCAAQEDIMP